jgi:hypothetical protein
VCGGVRIEATSIMARMSSAEAQRRTVGSCPQCDLGDTVLHDASGSDTVRWGTSGTAGWSAARAWRLPAGPCRARCCGGMRTEATSIMACMTSAEAQRRSVGSCPQCDLASPRSRSPGSPPRGGGWRSARPARRERDAANGAWSAGGAWRRPCRARSSAGADRGDLHREHVVFSESERQPSKSGPAPGSASTAWTMRSARPNS